MGGMRKQPSLASMLPALASDDSQVNLGPSDTQFPVKSRAVGGLKPTFSLSSMLPDDTSNGSCTEPKSQTNNAFSVLPELRPEHTLGPGVEEMPMEALTKTPMKPTSAMKDHLAAVKSRTKLAATESFSGCGAWTGAVVSEAGTSELRTQNEDRWSLVEDVSPGLVLLAVYDGHGGNDAAHFLQQRLPGELAKQLLMSGGGGGGSHDVAAAMRKAVAFCERKFCEANLPSADNADEVADLEVPEGGYTSSGSCLVAAVYDSRSGELVVANLGDSRAVLALPPCTTAGAGETGEAEEAEGVAVALTRDQTAANPLEWTRITALGATVDEHGYIQGEMTPSRAVGDVQFKGGDPAETLGVIGTEPELTRYECVPEDAVLLLASDGLWDALSSREAAALVHRALRNSNDLAYAARALVLEATQVRGSEDDTTLVALHVRRGGLCVSKNSKAAAEEDGDEDFIIG